VNKVLLSLGYKKLLLLAINPRTYFILLIIFLPTQTGFHFWPSYTRIFGLRIDYLAPTIYLTDILMSFLIFCYLLKATSVILRLLTGAETLSFIGTGKGRFLVNRINTLTALFLLSTLALALLNILSSGNWKISLYQWFRVGQLIFLGWYVYQNKESAIKILKQILPYQLIFISLLAITQLIHQSSLNGIFWWLGERTFTISTPGIAKTNLCINHLFPYFWNLKFGICNLALRPYATFSHPNSLAGYLLVSLVLIRSFFQEPLLAPPLAKRGKSPLFSKEGVRGSFSFLAILFGTLALILTFSHTAWLAGLVVLIFYLGKHLGGVTQLKNTNKSDSSEVGPPRSRVFNFRYHKPTIAFCLFVFLSIALLFLSFSASQSFSFPASETITLRLQLFQTSWQLIQDHWLLGVGLGNFIPVAAKYLSAPTIALLQPVHNIFWLITSETGVFGLIFILWFIKTKLLNHKYRQIPITNYQLVLIVILITGSSDHYWLTLQQNRLLLTIIFGLIV